MQHDWPHRGSHSGSAPQEPIAQDAYPSPTEGSAGRSHTQFLLKHVRGGGEQCRQLFGQEVPAVGSMTIEPVAHILGAGLDGTGRAVDRFEQVPRRGPEVGDHEARIVYADCL